MNTFTPVLRFVAVSDIHFMTDRDRSDRTTIMPTQQADLARCVARLNALFEVSYDYAQKQPYNTIDAFLMAGDQTDDGTPRQIEDFFAIVKRRLRPESRLLIVNGNHEFYDAGESSSKCDEHAVADRRLLDGLKAAGLPCDSALRFHTTVKGYHFLGISPTAGGGRVIGDDAVAWLAPELAAAAAEGGKTRPIFVFQHHQMHDTVYGCPSAGSARPQANLRSLLATYPQVVDFGGHTHAAVEHPEAIWQGEFTAVNTGSLSYCGVIAKVGLPTNDRGGFHLTGHGDPYDEYNEKETAEFTIVELDKENRMRLLRVRLDERDDRTPHFTTERVVSVGDPARGAEDPLRLALPAFPAGAALTRYPVETPAALQIRIPQALCAAGVELYRCELYQNGALVQTVTRLSGQYRCPVRDCVVPFTGLTPGTAYTVRVFPVSTMGTEGEPLEACFTTAPQPDPLAPDVFSVQFRADGSAVNAVNGDLLTSCGEVAVSEGKCVLRGAGDLQWRGLEPYYELFQTNFTFVLRARIGAASRGRFLAANFAYHVESAEDTQVHGGFGFKQERDGRLSFYLLTSSKDVPWRKLTEETLPQHAVTTEGSFPDGAEVHLIGVYDGTMISFYVDGRLVGSIERPGVLDYPLKRSCQYLSLGGDSGLDFHSRDFMTGEIQDAAVFSAALRPEQASALYERDRNLTAMR